MSHKVINRTELQDACLEMGGARIQLADYATTGLRIVAVAPSGTCKTNAGLVIAEQLVQQGWVSVLIDPEGEIESMYGAAVSGPEELARHLKTRDRPFIVVSAKDATEFVSYGKVILECADSMRKPVFVVCDEGQCFSASRKRSNDIGEASDIINEMFSRGRKRALDVFITTLTFSSSIHRAIFANKNLTLVGPQEDPASWALLAPQFRSSQITYGDVLSLSPSEFYCFSRRGVDKIRMPMAEALKKVAPPAKPVKKNLPTNFKQWDRAMRGIPVERLQALTDPVVALLTSLSGISTQQAIGGHRALVDELEIRQ